MRFAPKGLCVVLPMPLVYCLEKVLREAHILKMDDHEHKEDARRQYMNATYKQIFEIHKQVT